MKYLLSSAVAVLVGLVVAVIILAVNLNSQSNTLSTVQHQQAQTESRQQRALQSKVSDLKSQLASVEASIPKSNFNAVNDLGFCYDVSYGSGSVNYVSSVYVTAPVLHPDGTSYCPGGTFVPVKPQPSQGQQ